MRYQIEFPMNERARSGDRKSARLQVVSDG